MIASLHWTPDLELAPRERDSLTGLRNAACLAQDLPLAVAGGDPLCLAVVHVGRPSPRSLTAVAAALAELPGFPYRTGPDTFAVLAPGVSPWTLQAALSRLARRQRRRRVRAGMVVAGPDPRAAALGALAALVTAEATHTRVAVR